VSGLLAFRFGQEFGATRALYGIAASVHAWIEVPLIVLALTRTDRSREQQTNQHRDRIGEYRYLH
jgi:hypothetical protein